MIASIFLGIVRQIEYMQLKKGNLNKNYFFCVFFELMLFSNCKPTGTMRSWEHNKQHLFGRSQNKHFLVRMPIGTSEIGTIVCFDTDSSHFSKCLTFHLWTLLCRDSSAFSSIFGSSKSISRSRGYKSSIFRASGHYEEPRYTFVYNFLSMFSHPMWICENFRPR